MDFVLSVLENYGVDLGGVGLFVFFLRFFHERVMKAIEEVTQKLIKFITDGSKDIKHEQAVKKFNKAIKTATRCVGYETRLLESNAELRANHINLTHAFYAVWANEWGEIIDTLYGVTYKGMPLETYMNGVREDWEAQRDLILEDLKKATTNQSTKIQQLEKHLAQFKHQVEFGALRWLDTGFRHKENILKAVVKDEEQDVIDKEDAKELG